VKRKARITDVRLSPRNLLRTCYVVSAVTLVAMLASCGPADPAPAKRPTALSEWAYQRMSSGFQQLIEPQPPCRDCLAFEPVANLRNEGGREPLPYGWHNGVVDRNGNFWVGQGGMIRIFDPQGMFLRDIGRSGQGPFEFKNGLPIFSDTDGNVHVYDTVSARETIISSDDFTLVDTIPTIRTGSQIAPLPDGRYVMARWAATPERIGFPLHVFDGTKIIRSFGIPQDADQRPLTNFTARREVATDPMGHIFSAEPHRYLIEAWTMEGIRILGLEGPRLNDREIPAVGWSHANPPPQGLISGIRVYDGDRLFVLSYQRRENWLDSARESIRPNGVVALDTVDGMLDGFYTSRIDVIDLSTATLIASGTHERILSQFLDDYLVADFGVTEEGDWRVSIWRIDVMSR
jgi:hypothetical protein